MSQIRKIAPLVLGIIATGLAMGFYGGRARVSEYVLLSGDLGPLAQADRDRTWKPVSWVEDLVIESEDECCRLRVGALSVGPTGSILIMDWSGGTINIYSSQGEFVREILLSNALPNHFAVSRSGELWVSYGRENLIKMLSRDGNELKEFHLPVSPHRLVLDDSEGWVIMPGSLSNALFHRYNALGRPIGTFGKILTGDIQDPQVLDGWLEADGEGGFVWSSYYSGMLASYSLSGERRFLVQTLGGSKLPRIVFDARGRRRIEPGTARTSLRMDVAEGRIYVLGELRKSGSRKRILDVYSNQDGSYLYSMELPVLASCAVVVEQDTLYTCGRDKVTRWRWHLGVES